MTLADGKVARRPSFARGDLVWLLALGLAANVLLARWVTLPGYTDAYYYFGSAVQLARGQGFTEPYLWNYLGPANLAGAESHRWPSHLYWMPLPALVTAPFMAAADRLAGRLLDHAALFRAAQVPMVALAAALPLLSYAVAMVLTGDRRHAWAAALLTLFNPYYLIYWTTTESFALYALVTAGALLAAYQASRSTTHPWRWLFAAGLAAGLAHLTRADGVLVAVCIAVWWAYAGRAGRTERWRAAATGGAVLAGGYLLVIGPWLIRNLLTVGALLPAGGLRAAWLVEYNDLFTFRPETLTAARYFSAGWRTVWAGKWEALQTNAASLAAVQTNIIGLPLLAAGAWRLRRHPLVHLVGLYALALFGLMTFVFTFPGERGGFLHSSTALLPFVWPLMVLGLDAAVEATARRLPHWRPERSRPVFTALLMLVSFGLAAVLTGPRLITWAGRDDGYVQAGGVVATLAGPGALVTVNDPPGWYYATGAPAIVIPTGGRAALLAAMTAFGSHWLILDENCPPELAALYSAPEADPALRLRATLGSTAAPVYVLELTATP
jgi:hypothetical protein